MTLLALSYIALAIGGLSALCMMILRIGAMIGACPTHGAATRAAAVTIATGFAAICAGGVILVGVVLPLSAGQPAFAFLGAAGLASLCFGLGFTHANGTQRAVILQKNLPAAG